MIITLITRLLITLGFLPGTVGSVRDPVGFPALGLGFQFRRLFKALEFYDLLAGDANCLKHRDRNRHGGTSLNERGTNC
jgi:hypothetical protein